ncbi:MAG: recombinase RecA [Armatimonadetes bacterium]|nr:recombinase RecA [Armatimonadota bacterium]
MSALQSTGLDFLDAALGGGLQPGTLTVVRGATGVGKTQLGLCFLHAGQVQEGQPGIVLDLGSRGDSQQHAQYARRLFGWELRSGEVPLEAVWNGDFRRIDYLNPFGYIGQRVLRDELSEDQWRAWKLRLNENLRRVLGHCYYHFVHGVRRVLVDGIEPFSQARDSAQIELFEYILHQILRKPHDWVARDLFMGRWQEVREQVMAHAYDPAQVATVFLQTTPETDLHQLITAQTMEDDLTTNATTVILMGRLPAAERVERGLFVLKHRGAWCSDDIVRFRITANGLTQAE